MVETQKKQADEREDILSASQRRRKQRLEGWAIFVVAFGIAALTLIQREVIDLGPGLSDSQGLVALVSINVSVLLTTLLIILILRQLYRIFFERQGYGSLQTKLVVAFISLSLLPSVVIFYYSYRQLVRGHELWSSSRIEEALNDSLDLTRAMLLMDESRLGIFGGDILDEYRSFSPPLKSGALPEFLEEARSRFHLTCVELYDQRGQLSARAGQAQLPPIYHEWFSRQFETAPPWKTIVMTDTGELTRLVWPMLIPTIEESGVPASGYLAVGELNMVQIHSQMENVRHRMQVHYEDVVEVKRPLKVTQLTGLTAMALLAVFISVWIGSHLARSLTQPVMDLVTGTQRVAAGDMDYTLEPQNQSGEFAELVNSFNQMTRDLKQLYSELDSRRRFVETVLKNVSTGVVVLDTQNQVQALNRAAEEILLDESPQGEESRGGGFDKVVDGGLMELPAPLAAVVREMSAASQSGRRVLERHVSLPQGEAVYSLKVSLTGLRNEEGQAIGYLMAFDDLTELEKAQRLAAWREVARRIAHEVKNPLTPIQLSAQRLRRRFSERLAGEEDAQIFSECTDVIIRQVEEMKNLVDEFSRFARLPEIKPRPGDFTDFLNESLGLFRQAHKKVEFSLDIKDRPPVFSFDPEQMRRVLTNILDNAVSAVNGEGQVFLTLETDELSGLKLTISDTGPGLDPKIRERIFDPHVTTKDGGQGLGLAIVRTIISDHGGFIKAKSRAGEGAKFVIELPLRR